MYSRGHSGVSRTAGQQNKTLLLIWNNRCILGFLTVWNVRDTETAVIRDRGSSVTGFKYLFIKRFECYVNVIVLHPMSLSIK